MPRRKHNKLKRNDTAGIVLQQRLQCFILIFHETLILRLSEIRPIPWFLTEGEVEVHVDVTCWKLEGPRPSQPFVFYYFIFILRYYENHHALLFCFCSNREVQRPNIVTLSGILDESWSVAVYFLSLAMLFCIFWGRHLSSFFPFLFSFCFSFSFFSSNVYLSCWRAYVVPVVSSTISRHCIVHSLLPH